MTHTRAIPQAERRRLLERYRREARRVLGGIHRTAIDAFATGRTVDEGAALLLLELGHGVGPIVDLYDRMAQAVFPAIAGWNYDDLMGRTRAYAVRQGPGAWAEAATEWVDGHAGDAARGMTKTSISALRAQIAEGIAREEGVDKIARRLRRYVEGFDRVRAQRWARTEVITASNVASRTGAKHAQEVGAFELEKEWLWSGIAREDHEATNGQRRDIDALYDVAGHAAMHPHDARLPLSQVLNCGCTEAYIPK